MNKILILSITKHGVLIALFMVTISFAYGQTKPPACGCPKSIYASSKADTIFHLSNGKSIALCGNRDDKAEKGKVYFSEFVLAACGGKQIIKFWGAVQMCRVRVLKDTLLVETMVNLPIGKDMAFKWTVWTIEHIYFVDGKSVHDFVVNRQIPKYKPYEIETTLSQYEYAKKEITDANMEIADKLFMSAISGNQKARVYLKAFKYRFGAVLDGVYAEEYNDVMRRLKLWDTNITSEDNF